MTRRILVLTGYFFRSLLFSLTGIIYVILALVYWAVFFPPGQVTPEIGNYILIIGAFGAVIAFLATLAIASRANRAENYPLIVRLPSRVEYITAVMSSTLLFTFLLQLLVAVLALVRGPTFSSRMLDIPPLWISLNILAIVLAMHASDLVASGWSRVVVFGILALLLLGQSVYTAVTSGIADFIASLSNTFYGLQWIVIANALSNFGAWLRGGATEMLGTLINAIFWPFRAIVDAVFAGYFTPTQALAPAVLLLYATILFLLAADLFATKDLELVE